MQYYRNLSGISRVHAYEISRESITVQLDTEDTLLFTYASAGMTAVEKMKDLAAFGSGLNRYIKAHGRDKHARLV